MSDFPVLMTWQDEPEHKPKLGDGVSRPMPGEKTKTFCVEVSIPRTRPMRWWTNAPSSKDALKYAQNIWPHATVKLLK